MCIGGDNLLSWGYFLKVSLRCQIDGNFAGRKKQAEVTVKEIFLIKISLKLFYNNYR
jgi:hypothetical protein